MTLLQQPEAGRVDAADSRLIGLLIPIALATIFVTATVCIVSGRLKSGFVPSGFAGLAISALLLSGFGAIACICSLLVRQRALASGARQRFGPWVQTALTLLFAAGAAYALLRDWPMHVAPAAGGFGAASVLLLLATPWLLLDRYMVTVTTRRLPEIDDLRALLFLPASVFLANAILQIVAVLGFGQLYWARVALEVALLMVCVELVLRVSGMWFLPAADSATARAPVASFVAGVIRGRSLSPASVAGIVRTQFGMDFSRSWALRFMQSAAPAVIVAMLVFCWFLTGVTRVEMNQRGAYERFGSVASILQPGLHLMLPFPFGIARHVEFGVLHSVMAGDSDQGVGQEVADRSTAEGDAPASANRLWDAAQPSDVSYIIASGEQNRQSFQTVSASVRVVYRIGLSDQDASSALYNVVEPDALVHSLSGRLLAQYFAAHTLPDVLGEDQGVIAGSLRTRLQAELDGLGSGIEIVTVTVEAIHPPSGAASAYRNVQAAEIAATTQIAAEQGRAQTTKSVAQMNAHGAVGDASATAAESVSAAKVDLIDMTADVHPYHAASKPFLLERYFTDVNAALANVPLEIVDHRLDGAALPTIDLRPPSMVRDVGVEDPALARKRTP